VISRYPGDELIADVAFMIEEDYRAAGRQVTMQEAACLIARIVFTVLHDNRTFTDVLTANRNAWRSALGIPSL
jgi:hypothetical protein